jgi:L-threonylcarbamoyladenylate synthase
MKVLSLRDEYDKCLEEAAKALLNNELIVYPTDTVYGLGALATSKEAVEKVFIAKRRSKEKAISVMVGSLSQLLEFFSPNEEEIRYIYHYLPGPFTFIMKAKQSLSHLGDEVAVRVVDHFFCRKLCIKVNAPITATSANISNKESIIRLDQLDDELKEHVAIAIDGGETKYKEASTVVNIRKRQIIRDGIGKFEWL